MKFSALFYQIMVKKALEQTQNLDTGVDHTYVPPCIYIISCLEGNMKEQHSNNSLTCTVHFQIQFQSRLIKHDPEV